MDLTLANGDGWALLGSGDGRKLERFGKYVIDRPAPQAIWPKTVQPQNSDPAARFLRGKDGQGQWKNLDAPMPDAWRTQMGDFSFELRLTGFGNVGLFPEHRVHWPWLQERIKAAGQVSVLNLFAYTGGASILCALAGAMVTHVDAAKSVNAWAMVNGRNCAVPEGGIRYLADDALKFVRREARRHRQYHGIIIDPPTFGRGPKGEVWKIDTDFVKLLDACQDILHRDTSFILLTSHSPGVTPAVLRALLGGFGGPVESGEMLLEGFGPALPAGAYARWFP